MKIKTLENIIVLVLVTLIFNCCTNFKDEHSLLINTDLNKTDFFNQKEIDLFDKINLENYGDGIARVEFIEKNLLRNKRMTRTFLGSSATKTDSVIELRFRLMAGNVVIVKIKDEQFETGVRYYNFCMPQFGYSASKVIYDIVELNNSRFEIGDTIIGRIDVKAEKFRSNKELIKLESKSKDEKIGVQEFKGPFMAIIKKGESSW